MKKVIWNCVFCIVVCFSISSEANPQFGSYVSHYGSWQRPYYIQPPNQNLYDRPSRKAINTCDSCECGVTRRNRIVGGEHASHSEFPWLVKLDFNGRSHCGGTIISPNHIITAAHCTQNHPARAFTMRIVDGTVRRGRIIYEHPRYNAKNFDNDIAIIEMDAPVDFDGEIVKRICLPVIGQDFSGTRAVAAGWGRIYEGVRGNADLKKVILPILSKDECDKSLYGKNYVSDNLFCAGYSEGGKDSCQGDSGGPLIVRQNGHMILAGIVSNGRGCARAGYPGLYTKVSNYLSWISEHTNGECICMHKA